jgi:dephospho-CoA kinase
MLVIGITGQFASGKSAVARILSKMCRAIVINADNIGHEVLLDKNVKKQLIHYFGKTIMTKGAINRRYLSKEAFKDVKNHRVLCRITHPLLAAKIKDRLKNIGLKNKGAVVIIDAAVLIELGLLKYVDKLIVVKALGKEQVKRARSKWGLSGPDIARRIRLQIPLRELIKKADFIIDNSGSLEEMRKQAKRIVAKICPSSRAASA